LQTSCLSRRGEREGVEGRGKKWPKHCMHIWIKEI
jgi:hypothetical protein